ncbi:MAG: T9SS type A sorting domain-containing protein, partial [Bacteroidales bacterium]|nr:T9SS type A sorting domain-containing protein [Bacteroidales bacterium]
TDEWFPVCDTVYNEAFSEELCVWNTSGLAPGYFNIRITMCDNTEDQNEVEAVMQLVLTDMPVSTDDLGNVNLTIYPNPIIKGQELTVLCKENEIDFIEVFDLTGKKIFDYSDGESLANISFKIDMPESGIYFINFHDSKHGIIKTRKIIVQ